MYSRSKSFLSVHLPWKHSGTDHLTAHICSLPFPVLLHYFPGNHSPSAARCCLFLLSHNTAAFLQKQDKTFHIIALTHFRKHFDLVPVPATVSQIVQAYFSTGFRPVFHAHQIRIQMKLRDKTGKASENGKYPLLSMTCSTRSRISSSCFLYMWSLPLPYTANKQS